MPPAESSALLQSENDDPYVSPHISGLKSHILYAKISSWWCAYFIITTTLTSIAWPSQISAIVDPKERELYNGFIPAPGAFVSLIVTPVAGILSDYFQTRFGRRKVFILIGSIFVIVLQLCMATFSGYNEKDSLFIFMILICVHSFGVQVAAGPYSGLLPDLVHKSRIGTASGWLGAASAVGIIVGSLGGGILVEYGGKFNYWPCYIFLSAAFAFFALITIIGVTEIPRPAEPYVPWKQICKSFYLDPKVYKNFYYVMLSRIFYDMGLYSILPFMAYYFEDLLEADKPALMTSIVLGIIVVVSIPASLASGILSDRLGRKTMVYISTGIMGVGCLIFSGLSFKPSLLGTFFVGSVIGAGYGCFSAVDWALAIDCLPPKANVAKDLGVWHLSVVIPAILAPLLAGGVINTMKKKYSIHEAYCAFFFINFIWFMLACIYTFFIQVPNKGRTSSNADDTRKTQSQSIPLLSDDSEKST